VYPIDFRSLDCLDGAAGPANINAIYSGTIAQAKMQGVGRLRQVAARRLHLADHDVIAGMQRNQCADGVPVALRSPQPEGHVVSGGKLVLEEVGFVVEVVRYDVEAAAVGNWG
jgi:hypothetical protein